MTTAKNVVFIGLKLENCCLVGGIDFCWGGREEIKVWWDGGVYWGGLDLGGEE